MRRGESKNIYGSVQCFKVVLRKAVEVAGRLWARYVVKRLSKSAHLIELPDPSLSSTVKYDIS
jgi:hypothetical protein